MNAQQVADIKEIQSNIHLNQRLNWNKISYSLVAIGIFLRLLHYFFNRSLWSDEIYLSMSFIKMSFIDLVTLPLEFEQKAPVGFLWLVKLSVVVFGTSEMALRFVPLVCGIASLFLFISVAKHFVKPIGVAVATGILALSPILIYHSVEAKQYSTEVFCTILALYLYTRYYGKTDFKSLFFWSLWGCFILWFSYSSIFVLAGIAGGLSLFHLIKRDWKTFFLYLLPFSLWMLSFGINYFLFTYRHTDSGWLVLWFKYREGFMPSTLTAAIAWLGKKAISFLNFPLGLSWFSVQGKYQDHPLLIILTRMAIVPLFLLILGLIYSFKRKMEALFILTLPLILHIFASFLLLYPFYERLTVYLAPLIILLIAFGCERCLRFFQKDVNAKLNYSDYQSPSYVTTFDLKGQKDKRGLITKHMFKNERWAILLIFILLTGPFMHSVKGVITPEYFGYHKHWHQRNLYEYLNANYKPGDAVYIYYNAVVPYQYYSILNNYKFDAIEGIDHRKSSKGLDEYMRNLQAEIKAVAKSHKRVWVIYDKTFPTKIGEIDNEPAWYYEDVDQNLQQRKEVFNSIGKQTRIYTTKEKINLYLFNTQ